MSAMDMGPVTLATLSSIDLAVYVIATIIGLLSIFFILQLNRSFGGKVRSALLWFALGIAANLIAMVYTAFFGHTATIDNTTFDIHNLMMTVGMIFFVISAQRFSLLIPRV